MLVCCVCGCSLLLRADAILIEPARLLILTILAFVQDLFKQITVEDLVFSSFRHVHDGYVREYALAVDVVKQLHTVKAMSPTEKPVLQVSQASHLAVETLDSHHDAVHEQKLDDVVVQFQHSLAHGYVGCIRAALCLLTVSQKKCCACC